MIDIGGPLSISEEKLGAYIEGNLPISEMKIIESIIQSDVHLQELVDDLSIEETTELSDTIGEDFLIRYNDLNLPEIPTVSGDFLSPVQNIVEAASSIEALETEEITVADYFDCNSVDSLCTSYDDGDEFSQDDNASDYEIEDDINDEDINNEELPDDFSDF